MSEMAEAAGDGFDSPEAAAAARRRARLEREDDIYFPDLEEAGSEKQPDTQQKETS